ncbi:MAG: nucleotidyltransferase family protein [Nanoarchaeota archaeon]
MITNILKSNQATKLIYYFLETPNLSKGINELKEKTNFSNNLLYSGLKTLLTYNILKKNKTKYELNFENDETNEIIEILKKEKAKFKLMPLNTYLAIKDILQDLEQKEVNEVYLFGSFARGTSRTDSDIDIAVLPKIELSELQYKYEIKGIKVEFHCFEKFEKGNKLHENILKEGIKIV